MTTTMRKALAAAAIAAAIGLYPLHHWKCVVCGVGYWGHHPPGKFDTMPPQHWHQWSLIEVKMVPFEIDNAG
jgi:uncharacterized protein YqcC (DUF446 family)